jgi:hypothetical protein
VTTTKLEKAEKAFRETKAKHRAGKVTDQVYRNAKTKLGEVRADYRANVRDVEGFSPVVTGD